jgi:hypothetical protein
MGRWPGAGPATPFDFDDQEQRMSDASSLAKSLRERFSGPTEDRLGKALSDLLENPLLTGALGRAFDAREKAAQAQEVAMGALNIPSAADIERLTRRLRSVSYRLEGIEDGVGRLDRALASEGVQARLSAIEGQLQTLARKIDSSRRPAARPSASAAPRPTSSPPARGGSAKGAPQAKPAAVKAKPATGRVKQAAGKATRARPATRGVKPATVGAKRAAVKAKPATARAKPATGRAKPTARKAKPKSA